MRTVLALLSTCVLACGPSGDEATDTDTVDTTTGDPSLTIVTPTEDQQISGMGIDVRVEVANVTRVLRGAGTGAAGEGFVTLSIDGAYLMDLDADTTSITGPGVGDHTLTAEIVDPDGVPLDPVLSDEVHFTLLGP